LQACTSECRAFDLSPQGRSDTTTTSDVTADVVRRFIAAFQQKDFAAIPGLVVDDRTMEVMQPAPDGQRVKGYDANVRFWQAMVSDPGGTFETEEVVVCGDRTIKLWRYRFGSGEHDSVRGVTLIQVRNGKFTEALAYAKTTPRTALGQEAL
jgi:ketosteroid isomerase-like protein